MVMLRLLAVLTSIPVMIWAFPIYNMPEGVTPVSHDIFGLHMLVFYICVGIGLAVLAAMTYVMVKHRKSQGSVAAQFHDHFWVEIIWTVIPLLILVALAVPSTRVLMRMTDAGKPDINIKVTGYQWKWKYTYLDEGFQFFSNLSTPVAE